MAPCRVLGGLFNFADLQFQPADLALEGLIFVLTDQKRLLVLLNLSVEHVSSLLVILKVLVHHLLDVGNTLVLLELALASLSAHVNSCLQIEPGLRGRHLAAFSDAGEALCAKV